MSALDVILFTTVSVATVALAVLNFCRADWLWAVATLLLELFWVWMIHRKAQKTRE